MHLDNSNGLKDEEISIVVVAITDHKGKLLLVRRSATEENRALEWEVPGGHRDEGESIDETAVREAREEVGLEILIVPGRQYFTLREGGYGVMLRGTPYLRNFKLKLDEHDKAVWINPETVGKYKPAPPNFEKSIKALLGARNAMNRSDILSPREEQNTKKAEKAHQHSGRKSPVEVAKEFQLMSQSVEDPAWESLWKLGNMKKPDYKNFSVHQVPDIRNEVTGTDNTNDSGVSVHELITEALIDEGFIDDCQCTKHSKGEVSVKTENPGTLSKINKLAKKLGLQGRLVGSRMLVISRKADSSNLELKIKNPNPEETVKDALGTKGKVSLTPEGTLNINTQDPQKALETTNDLVSKGQLELQGDEPETLNTLKKSVMTSTQIQMRRKSAGRRIAEQRGSLWGIRVYNRLKSGLEARTGKRVKTLEVTHDPKNYALVAHFEEGGDPKRFAYRGLLGVTKSIGPELLNGGNRRATRVGAEERKEFTPEEYGSILDQEVENEDQLLMDLTFETNNLPETQAWERIKSVMLSTFPGYNADDIDWFKNRWKYMRGKTASKRQK